jgi:membrane protein implicated in regulation of membrane protease activity
MMEWWKGLTALNQFFFGGAAFFTLVFLWQFVGMLIGLSHGGDFDMHVEPHVDGDMGADAGVHGNVDVSVDSLEAHSMHDAAESTAAFHILSVRAILAFLTLFFWAGALYLDNGKSTSQSVALAMGWGVAAWAAVAVLLHWLRKTTESGNRRLSTAIGQTGTVYLDIPANGLGEVRLAVSGVVSLIKARSVGGSPIKAGSAVTVTRLLDINCVEVLPAGDDAGSRA